MSTNNTTKCTAFYYFYNVGKDDRYLNNQYKCLLDNNCILVYIGSLFAYQNFILKNI